jgi:hypothetical protein
MIITRKPLILVIKTLVVGGNLNEIAVLQKSDRRKGNHVAK